MYEDSYIAVRLYFRKGLINSTSYACVNNSLIDSEECNKRLGILDQDIPIFNTIMLVKIITREIVRISIDEYIANAEIYKSTFNIQKFDTKLKLKSNILKRKIQHYYNEYQIHSSVFAIYLDEEAGKTLYITDSLYAPVQSYDELVKNYIGIEKFLEKDIKWIPTIDSDTVKDIMEVSKEAIEKHNKKLLQRSEERRKRRTLNQR